MSAPAVAAANAVATRAWRYPSALIDRLTLQDGRQVVVRPVAAFDAHAEQDFVRSLSPASRLARFHFGMRELPPALLRAMTEVDHRQHVAILAEAFDGGDDDALMVADARYVRSLGVPQEAEFAIAVADAWQGRGLGRALMRHLARHAARHGVARLWGDVRGGNAGMLALTAALGGEFGDSPHGADLVRVAFSLTPPDRRGS